jgi:death-on-curing protein
MKEPIWVDRDDALAIHDKMLAQHGGLAGVRDEGMLASALAKPQNRFAYESASLPEMAGSYAAGIILNHPFLDGNKRTGFMVAAAFLEFNGWTFDADEADTVERTLALASGAIGEGEYAAWLKANSKRPNRKSG